MLQVKDLTVRHLEDFRAIVGGLSFTLGPGDKAAVIGEEGDGKSTLLKLIADPGLAEGYVEWSGRIDRGGARVGYLAQELSGAQKDMTGYEFLCATPAFLDATPKELAAVGAQLSLDPGLFYSGRKMGALSGGEKVKMQIAALLLERPDVLLLDEPSGDIDIGTLEWLEGFLRGCAAPVLFVSHDEVLLERTANMVIHIEQVCRKTEPRAAVERLGYRDYVEKRLHLFSRQERLAKKERGEYEKQQEKLRKIREKVEHRQATVTRQDPHAGQLLKKKMKAVKSQERRFEKDLSGMTRRPEAEEAIMMAFSPGAVVENGKKVVELEIPELRAGQGGPPPRGAEEGARRARAESGAGEERRIENAERGMEEPAAPADLAESGAGRVLARDIRLEVTGPKKVCVTGPNGTGKTTLIRAVWAALKDRQDIRAAYMPQNYADLLDMGRTPVEFLAPGGGKDEVTRARTCLGCVKFTADEMGRRIGELSGGQKAKLFFLKMILAGANVLVLDEPTRNFSPLSGPVIRRILRGFGGAVIAVSHDRRFIDEVCGTVYELGEGGLKQIDRAPSFPPAPQIVLT